MAPFLHIRTWRSEDGVMDIIICKCLNSFTKKIFCYSLSILCNMSAFWENQYHLGPGEKAIITVWCDNVKQRIDQYKRKIFGTLISGFVYVTCFGFLNYFHRLTENQFYNATFVTFRRFTILQRSVWKTKNKKNEKRCWCRCCEK